jgi:tetratricopeptide (TPR) repeat protein
MAMKDEKKDEYQKALASYGEAVKAFRQSKFDKAEEQFTSFMEKYGSERELVDRAKTYLKILKERVGKPQERLTAKSDEDYYLFGVYKMNMGDYEGALKMLEKAREAKPKDARVFYLLAQLACLTSDQETCLEHLKKAVQIDKFYSILAQNEAEFDPIREDKRFKIITRAS